MFSKKMIAQAVAAATGVAAVGQCGMEQCACPPFTTTNTTACPAPTPADGAIEGGAVEFCNATSCSDVEMGKCTADAQECAAGEAVKMSAEEFYNSSDCGPMCQAGNMMGSFFNETFNDTVKSVNNTLGFNTEEKELDIEVDSDEDL